MYFKFNFVVWADSTSFQSHKLSNKNPNMRFEKLSIVLLLTVLREPPPNIIHYCPWLSQEVVVGFLLLKWACTSNRKLRGFWSGIDMKMSPHECFKRRGATNSPTKQWHLWASTIMTEHGTINLKMQQWHLYLIVNNSCLIELKTRSTKGKPCCIGNLTNG